jgi:hypothetical protein
MAFIFIYLNYINLQTPQSVIIKKKKINKNVFQVTNKLKYEYNLHWAQNDIDL